MIFQDEKEFVGNIHQLFKVLKYKLMDGRAEDVKMFDIQNGSGMNFNINIDRGMDIPFLSYKGKNVGFVSPCGIVAPQYFDDQGVGFLRGFTAGFMTTGGLQYVGAPCEYGGESFGLHGRISNTPADNYSCEIKQQEDGLAYVEMNGLMNEGRIFQDQLSLRRNIKCYYQDKSIEITDKVTNEGYKTAQHMILYHCNIGYPILSPSSEVIIPSLEVIGRNEHSVSGINDWNKVQAPTPGYEEMCYYHKLKADANNRATVAIYNHECELGIAIEFDTSTLDHFVQWKMMGQSDYVMGLEPSNTTIDGIEDAINKGTMKYLEPNETVEYKLVVKIIEGKDEFEVIKHKAEK